MIDKVTEAGYIAILGEAIKAGNEATKNWDPNNWFPCGAGYVLVKPRNSKFARWLISMADTFTDHTIAIYDADYKKAVIISPRKFNQAMEPKLEWCSAACRVLRQYDIKCEMWSYID